MKRYFFILIPLLFGVNALSPTVLAQNKKNNKAAALPQAKDWVSAAVAALGGEEKLRAVQGLRIQAKGHQKILGQPDLAEGPWATLYQEMTEWRDLQNHRLRRDINEWGFLNKTIFADSVAASSRFNRPFVPESAGIEEWLVVGPERVLLYAGAAPDLRARIDSTLNGVTYNRVAFNWRGFPILVYLHKYTHLPTAVEITRPYRYGHDFFELWGEVTTRWFYSRWIVRSEGIPYPLQIDIFHNEMPANSFNLTKIEFNTAMPDSIFKIPAPIKSPQPAGIKNANGDAGPPRPAATEIAPGIWQITGNLNATIIQQEDGLVILEAPTASASSSADGLFAEASKRFPQTAIKAVVTTAYTWNYLGGVRDYVARGIPIYSLDLYQPLLQKVVAAPHRTFPDSLARKPRKPEFRPISTRVLMGKEKDKNRFTLYPTRAMTERLLAYFPEHRLLYASDLLVAEVTKPLGRGSMPQFLPDFINAVAREKLDVAQAFSLHMAPFPWPALTQALPPVK